MRGWRRWCSRKGRDVFNQFLNFEDDTFTNEKLGKDVR
jgi:hypothetical protein